MLNTLEEKFWSSITNESKAIRRQTVVRKKSDLFKSVEIQLKDSYIEDGWEVEKEFKKNCE
jgi:hypothetical protein